MNKQHLIIRLIRQDMKHTQLVEGVCRAGFETDRHHLQLMEIVAELMDIPENGLTETWVETYMDYLGKAALFSLDSCGRDLDMLAKECYGELCTPGPAPHARFRR